MPGGGQDPLWNMAYGYQVPGLLLAIQMDPWVANPTILKGWVKDSPAKDPCRVLKHHGTSPMEPT